ncbi:FtsX-like permease family protein [Roseofilum casamattae]|uniref:FtsX-like permease family protein n=1 Tax=Roseofilum casamattae BLCC-M143 TaxID=3022442 RepID=A0ABT7BTQ4_9CYAN|nr:FtsX-like permease family protein [Roseofilum casamattae]MDJ1181909.1 FtsX-like permease family protein [Roseofilum casamattae BLCC-M143]
MLDFPLAFKLSLAWRNLVQKPQLLLSALTAVTLAVFLIFSQLGFFYGITESSAFAFERLTADLIIMHRARYTTFIEEGFNREPLYSLESMPEIKAVYPLYITIGSWKNTATNKQFFIRVFGFNPANSVFDLEDINAAKSSLQKENTVLIDRRSRVESGFNELNIGDFGELSGRRFEIVGDFSIGSDVIADGNLIVSDLNFLRTFARTPSGFAQELRPSLDEVDYGLIELEAEVDADRFAEELNEILPSHLTALTKQAFIQQDQIYQMQATPAGFIFGLGVLVGLAVGSIVIYNIIYTDIKNNLPQYATLRAMGYSSAYLFAVIFIEAAIVATVGFLPGWLLGDLLYRMISDNTGLILRMRTNLIIGVYLATVSMCLISGSIAAQRLRQIDPAEIY